AGTILGKVRDCPQIFLGLGKGDHSCCKEIQGEDWLYRSLCGSGNLSGWNKIYAHSHTGAGNPGPGYAASLQKTIDSLPGIKSMKYHPTVYNDEVDIGFGKVFEHRNLIPILLFLDPWGYKGISIELVGSVLKHWGCDCILFFNYNRIQVSLTNPRVTEHMDALFGKERADNLREQLETVPADEKELTII